MVTYDKPAEPTYPWAVWWDHSPNSSPRRSADKITKFIIHHAADPRSIETQRTRFMTANDRSVSPNWLIGADGSVHEIVPPDNYRAWTTGAADYSAVTVETQNTSGAPDWGVTEESHVAIAHLVAWAHERYGIPLDRQHVIGHKEVPGVAPTSCPLHLDVDKILEYAIVEVKMATAPDLVTLSNGEVLARGVYDALLQLQEAGRKAGFNVYVSSGYRTRAKQIQIFTSRFRQQATGSGPFNDVRYWNGAAYGYPGTTRWVRHSSAGTVAVPGTSMHEKASAVDFGGIPAGGATAYARWLRQVGPDYGFSPTGYGFNEAWHYDYTRSPWAGSGSGSSPFNPGGFLMALSDAQQGHVYDALVNTQGAFYYKPDAIINIIREEIKGQITKELMPLVESIRNGDIRFPGQNWNAFDTLVNVSREPAKIATSAIDEIVAGVVANLPTGGGSGTTYTPEQVARAVRDLFKTEPLK